MTLLKTRSAQVPRHGQLPLRAARIRQPDVSRCIRASAPSAKPYKESRRGYATAVESIRGADRSHVMAGLMGGTVVILVGYGIYRYSSAHKFVSAASKISASSDPKQIMAALRQLCESYAATVPGAGLLVKGAFDQLDRLSESHGEAIDKWVTDTYREVTTALQERGESAIKVMEVLQRKASELQDLGKKVMDGSMEGNPKLKQLVGDSLQQLQSLADKHGPQVSKLLDDTQSQLKSLADQGLTASTLAEAGHIVRVKLREAQELAKNTGESVWADASEKARPYLAELPDVETYLRNALEPIKQSVGSEGSRIIKKTYEDLGAIARESSGKDAAVKARKLIKERLEKIKATIPDKSERSEKPSSGGLLSMLPGLHKLSPELHHLQELAQSKAPEAKRLLEETIADLQRVIEKRAQEASKLGQESERQTNAAE